MTYDELLKNRIPVNHLASSVHMMECVAKVKEKYPNAGIVEAGEKLWRLTDGSTQLSNAHNSHYACWLEARRIIEQLG